MENEYGQAGRTSAQRGGCVAIVDDDITCLAVLEGALRRQGLQTISFADGTRGCHDILARSDVSLVIANWMLPGKDGYLICRELAVQRPNLTTVLMLGRSCLASVWREMRLRADYVLPKPFLTTGLDEQIRFLVETATGQLASRVYRSCSGTT